MVSEYDNNNKKNASYTQSTEQLPFLSQVGIASRRAGEERLDKKRLLDTGSSVRLLQGNQVLRNGHMQFII